MKRRRLTFKVPIAIGIILFGIYVLFCGGIRMKKSVVNIAEKMVAPGVLYSANSYEKNKSNWIERQALTFFPLWSYLGEKTTRETYTEDEMTYQMILAMQANDEYTEEKVEEIETVVKKDTSLNKLKNFDYLLSHFYTVDSTTTIDDNLLDAEEMLSKDMKLNTAEDGPKILIFHTHSQEAFKDSKKGDASTTIVGMGELLAENLNKKGISTIHHKGVYDLIDGELDRSKAYQLAEEGVTKILEKYPTIEVVIDLHRDGVSEKTHLVTRIDGMKTAKIMFFNGLSRTKANGEITYLPNPYIKDNLAFSFQMQLAAEDRYPGFARRIYLKGYRYSLHMKPKSLLIEAGAQNNTVEEMKNAMNLLSNVLCDVLVKTE